MDSNITRNLHIATNDPELQMYHNFGFLEDEINKDKAINGIYVIEGYNIDKDGRNGLGKGPALEDSSTTSDSANETKVDLLEFIRKSFRRKRRLSAGDKPYGLSQKHSNSDNVQDTQAGDDDAVDDKVLLGRAGVRSSSHLVHPRRSIRLTQVAPSNSSIFPGQYVKDICPR
ncbi:hypothetical protein LOTGIDRAFT_167974 [Lottia gigantea]|uniref:Uncharacterized protein n=1 Tax=Lottia gigantea TaxID=225164 RepID=V3ZLL3_LOTGI|nr:hypothetical protein LOTGIDRAFT_167974 [Lottia gigantea]ESO85187.1 hypothetical protein LOTGIDRAFT_167974 [Lottia gigantea]